MYITSSANLRNNYRKIANHCKETKEPVFLTTNGEGELVLMSIEAYEDLVVHRKIENELIRIEAEKESGHREYVTLQEFESNLEKVLYVAESEEADKKYGK